MLHLLIISRKNGVLSTPHNLLNFEKVQVLREKLSNDVKTKEKLSNDLKTKEKLSNDMRFENKSFPAQGFPPCRAVKYQEVAGAAARRKNYLQS